MTENMGLSSFVPCSSAPLGEKKKRKKKKEYCEQLWQLPQFFYFIKQVPEQGKW